MDRGTHLFLALAAPGRELDLSDPRDRLNASFIAMMDEYYAADIAQRMRDSVAHRRSEGKTVGPAPFGTIRDDEGYLKPNPFGVWLLSDGSAIAGQIGDATPHEDAIWRGYHDCAKRILELYSANQHGLKVIAARIATEGWRFRSRNSKPRRITQADVRQVIANWRAYAGLVVPVRARDMTAYLIRNAPEILYDTGRSVFDLALIRKVAEVQTARSFSTRPFGSVSASYCYPLTGVLYCARCEYRARVEKNFELRAKIGGTNKYSHLHYRHYQGTVCTCQRKSVHADEVETDFQRLLELLSTSTEQLPALVSKAQVENLATNAQSSPLEIDGSAEDNLAKCQRRLEAIRYLFEDGDLSRDEYIRRNEQLAREMAHWEAQRVERDAPADELGNYAESFQRMAHLWAVTTPEDKQILIRSVFEAVYYDMDTRQIIDFQLKPGADRYLIARFALYEDERWQADKGVAIPDAPASQRHFDGWSVLCPEGGYGAQIAPELNSVAGAAFSILKRLYTTPLLPDKAMLKTERNKLIRERYATGETLERLAGEFGVSFQRVHQIVHQRHH